MPDLYTALENEVVERGETDWVSMAEMVDIARSLGAENPRDDVVEFMISAADNGVLVVGEYRNGSSFVRWPERGDSLRERIRTRLASNPVGDPLEAESNIMVETL
ncbi:hypothetical protein [Kocuria marina]|uniref:hypothetical protein n=1 Tax=Kocuria marina TaxID=223184 RepID=UPI0022E0EE99|nr:hypothetical protein [Kocuria marina]